MWHSFLKLLEFLYLRHFWQLHIAYVPRVLHVATFVFAVVAFYLFGLVGQIEEIYIGIIEQDDRARFVIGMALVILLSSALVASYLAFTDYYASIVYGSMANVELAPWLRHTRFFLALLSGMLPLLGVVVGIWGIQSTVAKSIDKVQAAMQIATGGVQPKVEGAVLGPASFQYVEALITFMLKDRQAALPVHVFLAVAVASLLLLLLARRTYSRAMLIRKGWRGLLVISVFAGAVAGALTFALVSLPAGLVADESNEFAFTAIILMTRYYLVGSVLIATAFGLGAFLLRESDYATTVVKYLCLGLAAYVFLWLPLEEPHRLLTVTRRMGALGMVALQFLSAFTLFLLLYALGRRIRLPLIVILIAILFLTASWRHLWDAAAVKDGARHGTSNTAQLRGHPAAGLKNLDSYFNDWLIDRAAEIVAYNASAEAAGIPGRRYPIYVIAMQGGGIYAASSAASFLARLQDACPHFARHVLAISAVSGGSVGSALFSAALERQPNTRDLGCPGLREVRPTSQQAGSRPSQPGKLSRQLQDALTTDHLSPVLGVVTYEYANRLLLDLPDGLLLGLRRRIIGEASPQARHLTRATALEASLSSAMIADDACEDDIAPCQAAEMKKGLGLYAHQDLGKPLLLLNTTFAETGQRVPFSPILLKNLNDRSLTSFHDLGLDTSETTLATAAVASARFPVLMPAYSPSQQSENRWNFVDGGYADNSGVATAAAVVKAIRGISQRVSVRLLILTDDIPEPDLKSIHGTHLSDTRAPLDALLNVRSSISSREIASAVERLQPEWSRENTAARREGSWNVAQLRLDQANFSLKLGWNISRFTNTIVSLFVARPEYCPSQHVVTREPKAPDLRGVPREEVGKTDEAEKDAQIIVRNACLIRDLMEELDLAAAPSSASRAR